MRILWVSFGKKVVSRMDLTKVVCHSQDPVLREVCKINRENDTIILSREQARLYNPLAERYNKTRGHIPEPINYDTGFHLLARVPKVKLV